MRIIAFLLLVFSAIDLSGQNMDVSQGWTYVVSSTAITEAGNDYSGVFESPADQTLIDFKGLGGVTGYTLSVKMSSSTWPSALSIWIRRTGSGTQSASTISGGTNYFQLTTTNQSFFTSQALSGTRKEVPVQYQIRGASVLIPAQAYSASIIYTVSSF